MNFGLETGSATIFAYRGDRKKAEAIGEIKLL